MSWFRALKNLVRRVWRSDAAEHELDEEIRAYFEILVERGMERGLSREAAERAVRVKFEGPEQVKEKVREARVGATMEAVFQDLRYATRALRRDRGFTFFAVSAIALALGANAAIFSLVDGILLKAAGYPEPERIVQLWEKHPSAESLKEGGRSHTTGRSKLLARNVFVGAQVAVAFILLVGGGLLVRSLQRLMDVETGFESEGVMAAYLPLPMEREPEAGTLTRYVDRILEEVRAVPGMREAAVTTGLPLRGWGDGMPFGLASRPEVVVATGFKIVSPGYFRALGLPGGRRERQGPGERDRRRGLRHLRTEPGGRLGNRGEGERRRRRVDSLGGASGYPS